MNDILAEDDLCPIACAWNKATLSKWLTENGIPYVVARSGWPRVHRKALERALGVEVEKQPERKMSFNFDSLK